MVRLNIDISAEVAAKLRERATEAGYASVEAYTSDLLKADAEGEGEYVDEATERMLLERLDDPRPGVELTPEAMQQFFEELRRRRQSRP